MEHTAQKLDATFPVLVLAEPPHAETLGVHKDFEFTAYDIPVAEKKTFTLMA